MDNEDNRNKLFQEVVENNKETKKRIKEISDFKNEILAKIRINSQLDLKEIDLLKEEAQKALESKDIEKYSSIMSKLVQI